MAILLFITQKTGESGGVWEKSREWVGEWVSGWEKTSEWAVVGKRSEWVVVGKRTSGKRHDDA